MALAIVLPAVTVDAEASKTSRGPNLKDLKDLPEGGIIELNIGHASDPELDHLASPVAYLMSHTADPEKFPHQVGECATQADGVSPFSQSRHRTYIDAGELTFRGGAEDLTLEPERNVHDREGRDHDIAYHDNIFVADKFLSPGTEYEVHLAGSEQFPETTYKKGEAVYLPLPAKEIKPGFPVDGGVIDIPRGKDFVWTWEPANQPKRPGLHHYHWIGFGNPQIAISAVDHQGISTATLSHWCLHEDTGKYVISEETIDELFEVAREGLVFYGAAAYRFGELKGGGVEGRRLDFAGHDLVGASYRIVE